MLNRADITAEHIIPKSYYPDDYDGYKPTVRGCKTCNSKYSKIEAELLPAFAVSISPNNPVAKGIWNKIRSSYTPRDEHDHSEKMHRMAKEKKIANARVYIPADAADQYLTALHAKSTTIKANDQGILSECYLGLKMRADYVRLFTIKMIKGFYFFFFDEVLPNNIAIETFFQNALKHSASFKDILRLNMNNVRFGEIHYVFYAKSIEEHTSVFYFYLWGTYLLAGVTNRGAVSPS